MLCVISHIRNYASDHSDSDNRKQVRSLINVLFHGLSIDKMDVNQDIS